MPRLYLPEISSSPNDYLLGLWEMSDSPSSLLTDYPDLRKCTAGMLDKKSEVKRLEYISVRALLLDIMGYVPDIKHNIDGKPLLLGGENISISHTRGYAAVILSKKYNVAVDIEYISDRVCRIADRFLRDDEDAESTIQKIISWCAKETLYKLHSSEKLRFQDMRIENVKDINDSMSSSGTFYIENLKRSVRILMSYIVTDMFVITYAVEKI